jgi:long-chain fatty acid transport protein
MKETSGEGEPLMKTFKLLALMLALTLVSGAGHATNGYFAHGYGTFYKALAGAGVAFPLNTMAPSTNPAAMVMVGKRYDLGIAAFAPDREYTVTGNPSGFPGTFGLAPGTVKSGSGFFAIPAFGANWMVGDRSSVGLALYGNGGMNTDYDFPVFGVAPAGVNLSQLFIAPTYAVEVADGHALGFTGILAYQMFEGKGFQAFAPFSSNPERLTNNDTSSSLGGGVRIGYLGELTPYLSVGASYQSKIYMGKFTDYEGLFAEQGGFDIPATWVIGTAIKPNDALAILFDVQWISYSTISAIANPLLPNLMQSPLGADDGSGFGWEDTRVYKFGVHFTSHPGLTWMGGYSYEREPIPESEVLFNIMAPGVVEQHLTFGFSKSVGEGRSFNFALMRALRKEIEGPNTLEAPGFQNIQLAMSQWELDFSFSFGF